MKAENFNFEELLDRIALVDYAKKKFSGKTKTTSKHDTVFRWEGEQHTVDGKFSH